MKGTVNWYNEAQGKGFICSSDRIVIFVNRSSLDFLTRLHAGDDVNMIFEKPELTCRPSILKPS